MTPASPHSMLHLSDAINIPPFHPLPIRKRNSMHGWHAVGFWYGALSHITESMVRLEFPNVALHPRFAANRAHKLTLRLRSARVLCGSPQLGICSSAAHSGLHGGSTFTAPLAAPENRSCTARTAEHKMYQRLDRRTAKNTDEVSST